MNGLSAVISRNRRFIPLSATILLALVAYGLGMIFYPGMRDLQVFLNIFRNNAFLIISAVGMTFVVLSGGIDLSVSGVVALVTVSVAALIRSGMDPWLAFLLMLLMGAALGTIMGSFVTFLKVQPFIATLAGMWFARGMCFFISDDAITINHPIYKLLGQTKILIPGLSEIAWAQGKAAPFVSIPVVVALLLVAAAVYVLHFTRFGRVVYAVGGNGNDQSARLMGLPVNSTKVLVYTISGLCSGLAGIVLSIFVLSGHGMYADGYEMDVIASVVMGGTMLTGGVGYVFGAPFGVLVFGITETLIQFNGTLSSWWTKIVIGMLTLMFIGVQSLLAAQKGGRRAAAQRSRRRRILTYGAAAAAILFVVLIYLSRASGLVTALGTPESKRCELKSYRQEQAASLVLDGAIIAYERNGGPNCIDELYAIYPDGRIVGDNGERQVEKQVTVADVNLLVAQIIDQGWFTDEHYDTWHTPCGQCYGYYLTVVADDQAKTVKGVDGGTDAPAAYWQVISLVKGIVPKLESAP